MRSGASRRWQRRGGAGSPGGARKSGDTNVSSGSGAEWRLRRRRTARHRAARVHARAVPFGGVDRRCARVTGLLGRGWPASAPPPPQAPSPARTARWRLLFYFVLWGARPALNVRDVARWHRCRGAGPWRARRAAYGNGGRALGRAIFPIASSARSRPRACGPGEHASVNAAPPSQRRVRTRFRGVECSQAASTAWVRVCMCLQGSSSLSLTPLSPCACAPGRGRVVP